MGPGTIVAFAICIAVAAAVVAVCLWLIIERSTFKGKQSTEYWTLATPHDERKIVTLDKESGRDFVILNFTDVQFNDILDIGKAEFTYATMDELVKRVHPDLITITGDIVWALPFTRRSVMRFIMHMDGYRVPWAPVFGNHDAEGNCDLNWIADKFILSRNCVFSKGPVNIGGVGNYVINIKEDGKVVHTLFMLDSHAYRYYPELDKTKYDFVQPAQIGWYRWHLHGIAAENGGVKPASTVFMHIPLPQFKTAYEEYRKSGFSPEMGFGVNNERVNCAPVDSGFFDVIKAEGSTHDVVCGHDHINDSSVVYQGVRLTYALKTGDRCYWQDDGMMNGGTVLRVASDGTVTTEHCYVNDIKLKQK